MEHIKKYQSEKSLVFGVLIWGVMFGTLFLTYFYGNTIFEKIIITIATIFVAIVWFGINYVFDKRFLIIKIGPFTHSKIDINTIKSVTDEKGNLTSSAATSFNKISIRYGKFDEVLLSPKNRKAFLEDLLYINSTIKINENLL